MLLRVVVVVLMNDRTTAVMAQLRGCHRWSFQVTAEVFHAAPGTPGLFGEVDFPGAAILGMQVAAPPVLIKDMAEARQVTGVDVRIVVT